MAESAHKPGESAPDCSCKGDCSCCSGGKCSADCPCSAERAACKMGACPKKDMGEAQPTKQSVSLDCSGAVRQAAGKRAFEVVVIREGFARGTGQDGRFIVAGRPLYWTKQAISEGVGIYEGAAVTAFRLGQEFNHLPAGPDRLKALAVRNEIGRLSAVHVAQADDGMAELRATLTLHSAADPVLDDVLQAWSDPATPAAHRGGFSIDAQAEFLPGLVGGVAVTQGIHLFPNPNGSSLDLVSQPAAGGDRPVLRRIAASITGGEPRKETIVADPVVAPAAPAAPVAPAPDPVAVKQAVEAAVAAATKPLRVSETATRIRQAAEAAKLPAKSVEVVLARFDGAESFDEPAVKGFIEKVTQSLAGVGLVSNPGGSIQIGAEPRDKLELEIEGLLSRSSDPKWVVRADGKTIRQALREAGLEKPRSFLQHFRDRTGHDFIRAKFGSAAMRSAVKQAISTSSYGDAWENVINRRFLAFFENPDYADWRRICSNIVQLPNYVKQERITVGSYANPPAVAEGADYTAATTPGDTGHGYTPAKYGHTESITEEAFLRDDVGLLSNVPQRMGTAMARLVCETVFDVIKPSTTGTMDYDGETLYDTDHDVNQNKGTTALAAAEVIVASKAMMKFTDQTASKRMGLTPRLLVVPIDLSNTAWDIVKPLGDYPGGSTTDNAWLRKFALEVIVVRHWTDATDWALGADPTSAPGVEVGFVGSETPEFFVQDNKTLGSVFDADKITYKTKIAFGAAVGRHESWYGEVVAG